jgi:hypothetical protein
MLAQSLPLPLILTFSPLVGEKGLSERAAPLAIIAPQTCPDSRQRGH